jgi:quinoprotein glucose dehydrogenase
LNRETGVPLFPVEEHPVPQTTVPGEETSPTQPLPIALPVFGLRQLTPNAKPNNIMKKKSEKTRQGLYNVGFIGTENS